MYCLGSHTIPGGTADNIITQTKSILDQLDFGVRFFDIRPFLIQRPDAPGILRITPHVMQLRI
jgi:hypothetical protein